MEEEQKEILHQQEKPVRKLKPATSRQKSTDVADDIDLLQLSLRREIPKDDNDAVRRS